jgi:IMP cyclohydrolase
VTAVPDNLTAAAQANLKTLSANPYPGRGIVLGQSSEGFLVQVYWLMGRSEQSRNRILKDEKGMVRTVPVDPAKVEDPSLIIYTALASYRHWHVVSNGDHTDSFLKVVKGGRDFRNALWGMDYEPDEPNNTPRIVGVLEAGREGGAEGWLGIVKANPLNGTSMRFSYDYEELSPGVGWGITTYQGAGDPLPSYTGEPLLLPLAGDESAIADAYWGALNAENRVALAVKRIDAQGTPKVVIKNQYGG